MKPLLFTLWCWAFLSATSARAAELRAGMARIDITPSEPVRMAGYASRTNLSQGVHDPLSARATVFEHDGQRLVLVAIDNLGFYNGTAEPLRKAIVGACQLKPSELFLCATHTHSAPALVLDAEKGHPHNVAYTKTLQGKLVEAAKTALAGLKPVQMAAGSGSSPVGVNRRQVILDNTGKEKIILGRNPFLMTDREVQVLKLARAGSSELAGALFAYATHSTSLGPRNYIISGDIHGLAEQFLEKYFGADVIAPGFAGASGNIDPWVRVLPEFRTTNGWVPEPVLMGRMLAQEVARVLEGVTNSAASGPVASLFKTLELPGRAGGVTNTSAKLNVTVGRVGEIAFVGLGGEVFNEIGKAIKSASPFRTTFIFTHCNGAAGYLPTKSSYAEGGYEVQSSSFGPEAAEMVIEETVRLLGELKGQ